MIATVIAIVMILLLVASLSIDFIYASKQTKSSDKNTLISAGAMTAIAAGVLLITVIVLDHKTRYRGGALIAPAGAMAMGGNVPGPQNAMMNFAMQNPGMVQQGMDIIAKNPGLIEAFI